MNTYAGMNEAQWRELARGFVRVAKKRDEFPSDPPRMSNRDAWKKGWKANFMRFASQASEIADKLSLEAQ